VAEVTFSSFTHVKQPPSPDGALRLQIPGRPPTPNARFGNRYAQASETKRWRRTAWGIALDVVNRSGWRAPAKARLTITFIVPDNRPRDTDNLVSSVKPLIDGLVDAKALVGDKSSVLVWEKPRIEVVRGVSATEFLVEVIDPAPSTLGL
jgi:Holliday junction resolvase RusA-like endonuclease